MLTSIDIMRITEKLLNDGVTDTVAWIHSHDEATLVDYLESDHHASQYDMGVSTDVVQEAVTISQPGHFALFAEDRYCSPDITAFCKEHNIGISAFNYPVIISEDINSCESLFDGCWSFNQPLTIPRSVYNCTAMFNGCSSFTSLIKAPAHLRDELEIPSGATVEWY